MLVISETLKGNRLNGVLISLSPLLTDLPIVVVSIYALQHISNIDAIYGLLSIGGGLFLIYLGIGNFRDYTPKSTGSPNYKNSVKIGIITNLLSPHPYIFWLVIGAPTFIRAAKSSTASQVLFIFGFYMMLVGSKVVVAILSAKIKGFLKSSAYRIINGVMGVILLIIAATMIYDGIALI